MPHGDPVNLTRQNSSEAGNRVQIESSDGAVVSPTNPVPVSIQSGATSGDPGVPGTIVTCSHWQVQHVPGANVQASVMQPAPGANRRLVCNHIVFTLTSDVSGLISAANIITEVVDSADGRIWGARAALKGTAGDAALVAPGVVLLGSVNGSLTFRFSAAPGAGIFETVDADGYTVAV